MHFPSCISGICPVRADLIIQLQANVEELKRQVRQIKETLKEMEEEA